MKKIVLILLSVFLFSFSSANYREVSATPCPPGNYSESQDLKVFKCVKVADSASANNQNGLSNEKSGPDWVKKFGGFVKALSVTVAYFTQVIAMLTIVYAAFIYTTSEGEPRKLRQAKMYLLYAFIGMFIGTFSLVISKMIGGIF